MNNALLPKVFGDSDLTIAINQSGTVSVFVGQKQIGFIRKLKLEASVDNSIPNIEIHLPRVEDPELDMKIESYARTISLFSWIQVIRQ